MHPACPVFRAAYLRISDSSLMLKSLVDVPQGVDFPILEILVITLLRLLVRPCSMSKVRLLASRCECPRTERGILLPRQVQVRGV